jgi:hypothetical protein
VTINATRLFEHLSSQPEFTITNYVVQSPAFSILRRGLRQIILPLREAEIEEADELASALRAMLSEWLTVPVVFDQRIAERLYSLGTPTELGRRWGKEIGASFEEIVGAVQALTGTESPLRSVLRDAVSDCETRGTSFRVYCHRQAIPQFLSLFEDSSHQPLTPQHFICSPSEYRASGVFHTLIKVGPLRSRGWGAAPDALLTAPRFSHLSKFVWAGCLDETDFGYDPAAVPAQDRTQSATSTRSTVATIRWRADAVAAATAESPGDPLADLDDLAVIGRRTPPPEYRRAVLVQIDDDHGILFPPYSRVLSYDPREGHASAVEERLPGESLTAGMYLILPILLDEDERAHVAEEGHYSRIWKAALEAAMASNLTALVVRLRRAGINLVGLRSRLRHWCKPAGSVIPAPQQQEHFRLLIEALSLDERLVSSTRHAGSRKGWVYAWNEIARSRGEAIQSGMLEHGALDQEVVRFLCEPSVLARVRRHDHLDTFVLDLTERTGISGEVRFHKVVATEAGYCAPESQLKQVLEVDAAAQWRE